MSKAMRAFVGVLAAVMLLAAGCGDDGSEGGEAGPEVPETDEGSGGEGDDLSEPPQGTVAVVDGTAITVDDFEAQFEQVTAIPAVAEQLDGAQGEAAEPIVRAQILSQIIVSDILLRGAEDDFGIEITDEEVEGRLEELEEEAGGEDDFARQLAEGGITEEVLVTQELPLVLTMEQVQNEVAGDAADEPPPPAPGGQQQPSEAELALQDWALGKFASAEVSVRSEIGTWDPQTGQIQPPGGAGGIAPPGPPAPG